MEFGKPRFVKETEETFNLASFSSKDEETNEDRSTLLRTKPGELKFSARRGRSTARKYKVDLVRRERRTNKKKVDEVTEPSPNQRLLCYLRVLRRTTNTTRKRQP